jgi:PTH2 family peptidyl-tRNA hydrolase
MKKKYSVKQVIVMRKDLKMRRGKEIAQGAHASMKVLLDKMHLQDNKLQLELDDKISQWLSDGFAKICLYIESEEEMIELYDKAKQKGLLCSMITDSGNTEFHGVPTNTCIAIGPDFSEKINDLTGHLKLA